MENTETLEPPMAYGTTYPSYPFDDPNPTKMPSGDDLPYDDGVPMENPWHRDSMNTLINSLKHQWRDRRDFFVGGNMFVYYSLSQKMNIDFRGPDFFVDLGADRDTVRKSWVAWEEGGRLPDVVIELVSETTAYVDYEVKMELYRDRWRTAEYFCYDSRNHRIYGWRLNKFKYVQIYPVQGRLWSEKLQMALGTWDGICHGDAGTWPRFFDANGDLILLSDEAEAKRAEAEAKRAESEAKRAEAEAVRANAAEAELAKLQAELEALRNAKKGDS